MPICPNCATENAEGARFCNACGMLLVAPSESPLPEERKVVTALFCDLVGFTATSEGADPEDVDRMLTRYFATARVHVEAHGGVVEKFIGDAIVGVFGVPAAHEDDPERAVRAALRIAADAAELPALRGASLRLRIGINTGEALVRHGVEPGGGERFMAGDAINTASRIQSVAPEMGVAVGLTTYEATAAQFDYEELEPATLKGKAEPVRIFHPIAPHARLGVDLTARPERQPAWLREARALVHDRFSEPLTLNEVAAAVGVEPHRLARAFRRTLGEPMADYVRRLRVETAAVLLRTTSLPISQVAADAGFADQSHLTRWFGRFMGMTPAQYRSPDTVGG